MEKLSVLVLAAVASGCTCSEPPLTEAAPSDLKEQEGAKVSGSRGAPVAIATVPLPGANRVFAFPPGSFHEARFPGPVDAGTFDFPATVAVIAGNVVQVLSADLEPRFSLPGLLRPAAVTQDRLGRFYVADTGHDRLMRFTRDGLPDPTFGTQGAWSKSDFKAPVSLGFGAQLVLLEDGSVWTCDLRPFDCVPGESDESIRNGLAEARLRRIERFFTESHPGFHAWLVDGKVVDDSSYVARKTKGPVLDATFGPTDFRGDFATVERDGLLRVYQSLEPVVTWPLANVRAVAADGQGRLYVVVGDELRLYGERVLR